MGKTGITDKNTGDSLSAGEFNTLKNTVDNNDDLRAAALSAAQAAQADATQALADANAAQSTADGKVDPPSTGNTLQNEIVADAPAGSYKKYTREVGGNWAFTMASTGNVDQSFFWIEIDQPASVSFSADFIQENNTSIDLTKLNKILGYYDSNDDKMYYSITTVTSQAGDITAPTVTSATVEDADPDALVVQFSEPVTITDTTGLSLDGDWTGVTISSVTSGSGTSTLTFALDTPIANGETGNFVYGGTNNIIDAASNALAAGSTAVTNNVAIVFTDSVSRSDTVGTRHTMDQTFSWATANRSISGWFKGVGVVGQPGFSWWAFSELGAVGVSGSYRSRMYLQEPGNLSEFKVEMTTWDGAASINKIYTFDKSGTAETTDGSWHHFCVTWDYDSINAGDAPSNLNDALKLYIDGVELSNTTTAIPADWNKSEMVNASQKLYWAGSDNSDDLHNDICVINRVLTSGEVSSIYNSGTPVHIETVVDSADIEMYITYEGNQYVDLMGNYTFTETAAGGSYSSDTPTNPA